MNQTIGVDKIKENMSSFNYWILQRKLGLTKLSDKIKMFSFKGIILDIQWKIYMYQIKRLSKSINTRDKSISKPEFSKDYVRELQDKIEKQDTKIAELEVKLHNKEKKGD